MSWGRGGPRGRLMVWYEGAGGKNNNNETAPWQCPLSWSLWWKAKMEAPAGLPRRQWSKWGTRTQSARHRSEIASPDQEWESDGRWGEDSGKGVCRETLPPPPLSSFLKEGGIWIWFQQSSPWACSACMCSLALQGNLEASGSPSRESERTRGREEGHAPRICLYADAQCSQGPKVSHVERKPAWGSMAVVQKGFLEGQLGLCREKLQAPPSP